MGGDWFLNFCVIVVFVVAVCGAIYWYAKVVGRGEAKAALEDPRDRNKVLIVSAGIIVFAGLVFLGLVIGGILKL